MKKKVLLVILLISLLSSCTKEKQEWNKIEISGKVSTEDINEIRFYPFENLVDDKALMQSTKLQNNNFKFSYTLSENRIALLMTKNQIFYIYIEPNTNIDVEIKPDNTIKFNEDSDKKNNSVYTQYLSKFSSQINYKLPPDDFLDLVDSLNYEKKNFIENNREFISDDFSEFMINFIIYDSAHEKLFYAMKYNNELIKSKNRYFDFLDEINIQNEDLINNFGYLKFVKSYINYLYLDKLWNDKVDFKNDYIQKYVLAKDNLKGKVLEQILAENLVKGLSFKSEVGKYDQFIEEFLVGDYSENLKNIVRKEISRFESSELRSKKALSDFELIDDTGEKKLLSEFKKDYIILDFWASWCKPCRESIPKLIEISKKYNENTDFAFISIDSNYDNWNNARNQLKIPSPNFIIDDKSKKLLGLDKSVFIPYYLVLNDKRRVVLRNPTVEEIQLFLADQ